VRGRNLDRLAFAAVTGLASAAAVGRRFDRATAVAEIHASLRTYRVPEERWSGLLSEVAAQLYESDEHQWWWRAAVDVLVQAGARPERVVELARPRTDHPGRGPYRGP